MECYFLLFSWGFHLLCTSITIQYMPMRTLVEVLFGIEYDVPQPAVTESITGYEMSTIHHEPLSIEYTNYIARLT